MKKKVGFTLLFYLKFVLCHSQVLIGLQLGATYNYLNTNISNSPSSIINKHFGYSIGLPVIYKVTPILYVEVVSGISQKNYSINRTDSLAGIFTEYKSNYLQLSLLPHFVYGKKLQIFMSAGPWLGYWLTGRINGKLPDISAVTASGTTQENETFQLSTFNENYSFNKKRDNRLELGWTVGGGLKFNFTNAYIIFIDCHYYQSLTDKQKNYMINQVPQFNQTFNLLTGFLYSLKQKHHANKQ